MIKKYLPKLIMALVFSLLIAQPIYAESIKFIHLKDGSVVKGKVVSLNNGIYTIETPNLGEIELSENDIVNITAKPIASQKNNSTQQGQLQSQVQQLQGSILSNPQLMQEIQQVMQNKEIMDVLSDQNLINDVMSYDQGKIEGNQKIQELMNNPEIQKLMNKIGQQLGN